MRLLWWPPARHRMQEVGVPAPCDDDGMNGLLRHALAAHGLLDVRWTITESHLLPAGLLHACRLHSMTPAELYIHKLPATPQPVPWLSAGNEWRALMLARSLLSGSPASLRAVEAALSQLVSSHGGAPAVWPPKGCADLGNCGNEDLGIAGSRVCLAECAFTGRGLVAACHLSAGDCAVSVPERSLLCTAVAKRSPALAGIVQTIDEGEWTEHTIMILLLLYERRRGRASRWAPWFKSLPHTLHNLSSWSETEALPLQGCAAYWRSHAARAELKEIRARLMPRLRTGLVDSQGVFSEDAYALSRWQWARAVIETRAISIPAELGGIEAGAMVLAPTIDFANHAEAPHLHLRVDDGCLQLVTVCPAQAGTQLCLSYGSFDAEGLLEHHGILQHSGCAKVDGSADAVPTRAPMHIPLSLTPCTELEEQPELLASVLVLMAHMDLALDGYLDEGSILRGEALPARLLGGARMCSIVSAHELEDPAIARVDSAPLSKENEGRAIEMLRSLLEDRLAALGDVDDGSDGRILPSQKRKREVADGKQGVRKQSQERQTLARRFCYRQRSLLQLSLSTLEEGTGT